MGRTFSEMFLFHRVVLFVFLASLCTGIGCGTSEKLYHVSGTAKYKGMPIPAGLICFDPDPLKGGKGQQGFATISEGKYTTAVNGRGIQGGAYVIRITGYDGKAAKEAPLGKTLFDEHSEHQELRKADQELNFDLPKK